MKLMWLEPLFSICKLERMEQIPREQEYLFVGKTKEELSVVCPSMAVPDPCIVREDGWVCLRVEGTLDFSLIGILAELTALLAEAGIGVFVVSTFDTDYILVKAERQEAATQALERGGHSVTFIIGGKNSEIDCFNG